MTATDSPHMPATEVHVHCAGRRFSFQVDPAETTEAFRCRLQGETGVPAARQRLTLAGQEIQDGPLQAAVAHAAGSRLRTANVLAAARSGGAEAVRALLAESHTLDLHFESRKEYILRHRQLREKTEIYQEDFDSGTLFDWSNTGSSLSSIATHDSEGGSTLTPDIECSSIFSSPRSSNHSSVESTSHVDDNADIGATCYAQARRASCVAVFDGHPKEDTEEPSLSSLTQENDGRTARLRKWLEERHKAPLLNRYDVSRRRHSAPGISAWSAE